MTDLPVDARPRRTVILLAAALLVVALAYSNALRVGFVGDDRLLIERHPLVQQLQPLSTYFFRGEPLPDEHRGLYRPLMTLSCAFDRAMSGGKPAGFHLTNLLLHLVCCALVFGLARRAGATPLAAALGVALFGTFPRLTESVTWVSGRTELLGGLGALGALLLHRTEPGRVGRRVAAAVVLLAGLLGNGGAAAGLAAIVVLELAEARRQGTALGGVLRNLAPMAVVSALYLALRVAATSGQEAVTLLPLSLGGRVLLTLEALGYYVAMMIDGMRPWPLIGLVGAPDPVPIAVGSLFVLIGGVGLSRARRRWAPFALALLSLALVALLQVAHLVRFAPVVVAADRFLYLPVAMLAVAVAVGISRLKVRRRQAAGALALLVATHAVAVGVHNSKWQSEIGLWRKAVESSNPLNRQAHRNLADALFERRYLEEALAEYRTATRLERELNSKLSPGVRLPEDRATLLSTAVTLGLLARYVEAEELFEELLRLYPEWKQLRLAHVLLRARQLRFDEANAELEAASSLPGDGRSVGEIGTQLARARADFAALPPERADEAMEVTARRAHAFDRLGAVGEARRLWRRVIQDEGASPEELRLGVGYLVRNGETEDGRQAHGVLSARAAHDLTSEPLRRVLEDRIVTQFGSRGRPAPP
jgi:tetratricopeptide (TPR) repeat protein